VVVALDVEAAEDLVRAFGVDELRPGAPRHVLGRRLVAVDAFEASLSSEQRKRRVWKQLGHAAPPGPVY
jgi:hypothetical protein